MTLEKFVVTETTGRLDKIIAEYLPQYSRSQANEWIKNELVRVNGEIKKAKYHAKQDEVITIEVPAPVTLDLKPQDIPLDIVYEDDDVLVVNKPQGMVVHPSLGHEDGTLVNALMFHTPLSNINGVFRPGIVHRIDKDTSGLLMVAKNDKAHEALSANLKAKKNLREYLVLVHGEFKENIGTIKAPLGRSSKDRKKQAVVSGGREAVTHFKVIKRFVGYTLLSATLETGRTHQIRVHLAYIGHPVAGDPLYGPKKTLPGNGQYLHAHTLGLTQPTTGQELEFEAPLPEHFTKMLDQLEPYSNQGSEE
ncbi:RluA family pseudouridine synthase [Weissella koreensis]|uniref:Pseudouridine synthase n=1 Tax=Weissella koreensis TaxID=165096 RepID=A0A7H1MN80_9LACO|nr:RluA family pseudouridine synthase [Weissella koreensis]AVH75714.1 RluA family pseudouridine synthase [Weissella koreensis]EJF34703.1 pseudouridylate synthase [Weissella koreensis KCTC 3621]MCZ9311428.1 RluA family pseudouridine synthase [Weissella koreensis]QGN20935.1 RluA family pseudouridine synthase [Weissella koreensis]QNT64916.1 RluA family pseudouridine synthase [Weissella koreensis]